MAVIRETVAQEQANTEQFVQSAAQQNYRQPLQQASHPQGKKRRGGGVMDLFEDLFDFG